MSLSKPVVQPEPVETGEAVIKTPYRPYRPYYRPLTDGDFDTRIDCWDDTEITDKETIT